MKAFFLLLTFIALSTSVTTPALMTIDLEIGDKTFIIKDKDEPVSYYLNKLGGITKLPKKHYNLFKDALKKSNFKCYTKIVYVAGFYQKFVCKEKNSDFSSIKLNYKFENYTMTFTGEQLFDKRDDGYHINFLTNSEQNSYFIGTKLIGKIK